MTAGSKDTRKPADLLARIRATAARALSRGSLEPIETDAGRLEREGLVFEVRVASALARKQHASRAAPKQANPFLPYEDDLFVTAVGDDHVCLLNKFNVLEDHALIVTREFETQESPLTAGDFRALADCLEQIDALGFYNAGPEAGASQPHKHLQLVPCPIGAGPERVPIEALLGLPDLRAGEPRAGRCDALPFRHALARSDDCLAAGDAGEALEGRYRELLRACGCEPPQPYNLLVTAEWMLLVPRRREHSHGIEVNSLGLAGAFFARDAEQRATIETVGPMQLLRDVTFSD